MRMLRVGGKDGSYGVHNPILSLALLQANEVELCTAYPGLAAAPPCLNITSLLNDPIGANRTPVPGPLIKMPPPRSR